MNFENWEILRELSKSFLDTVEMAFVFGGSADNALLITSDGRVHGVGKNTAGCLGLGHSFPSGLPHEMKLSNHGVKGFTYGGPNANQLFLVAHLDSGEIFWWGAVPFSANHIITTPEKISIDMDVNIRVKTVACGASHCAVVSTDGKVFTCGQNDVGQLGHDTNLGTFQLRKVKGIIENQTVIDVSCGFKFTVVLLDNGRVAAWGNNDFGQLGINRSGGFSESPVELSSLSTYYGAVIRKIVCGTCHVLALSETGTLYAWGCNNGGEMGIQNVPDHLKGCPLEVKVDNLRFIDISALYRHRISIAQCENGKIYFWGLTTKGNIFVPTETLQHKSPNDIYLKSKVMIQPMRRLGNSLVKISELEAAEEMTLRETLQNEFNNQDSSDLTIVVDEKKIYVHQSILKMRSKYFNVLITRWLQENNRVLEMKKKSFAVIEAYLKYLYTDNLEANLNLAVELLQLADEYGEDKLKSLCQNIILRDMKTDGVADVFANTRNIENCENLNRVSLEFSLRHAREVINSPGFEMWDADTTKDFVREYVKIKGNCL